MCDIVEERVQRAKEQFGVPEAYTDFQEMLARSDIEGMVNLTLRPMHGPLYITAPNADWDHPVQARECQDYVGEYAHGFL